MDNTLFSALTYNPAALHIDAEYAKGTIYGQRVLNSTFLLALIVGISVIDTTLGTTIGNLGFEEVRFPKPVFHGDTIRVRTEVAASRLSKSRTDSGMRRRASWSRSNDEPPVAGHRANHSAIGAPRCWCISASCRERASAARDHSET